MDVRQEVQSIVDDLGISTSLSDSDLDNALRGGGAGPGAEALSESSFASTLSEPPEAPPQSPPNFAKLRLQTALPQATELPVLAVLKQEVFRLRSELAETS